MLRSAVPWAYAGLCILFAYVATDGGALLALGWIILAGSVAAGVLLFAWAAYAFLDAFRQVIADAVRRA